MMKKQRRGGTPLVDERRPGKPAAPRVGSRVTADSAGVEPPSYDGSRKTTRAPRLPSRQTGNVKPAQEPVRRPRAGSGDVSLEDQVPPKTRGRGAARTPGEQYIRLRDLFDRR